MHLIVTRPEADAAEMAGRIEAMGHRVSLAPLLDMRPTGVQLNFSGIQAIVATSRNALRALADEPADGLALKVVKQLPIFVVGPASADLARDIGFTNVTAGTGGGRQLLPLIADTCTPAGDRCCTSAETRSPSTWGRHWAARDMPSGTRLCMRPWRRSSLPDSVAAAIRAGEVAGVIVMSARTAKVFVQLARKAGAGSEAERLAYLCISQSVADALGEPKPRVLVADRPTSEEMLALVKELASNWL